MMEKLRFTTPRGVLVYPKLNAPDTKFDIDGTYNTKFRFAADARFYVGKQPVSREELVAKLEELRDEFFADKKEELAESRGEKKAKARTLSKADIPIKPFLDEEGEETGDFQLSCKMKASGKRKDGSPWTAAPDIFDSRGTQLNVPGKPLPSPVIWGGSEGRLSIVAMPYYIPKDNEVGVSFRLEGFQLLKLVSGGGHTAEAHGFFSEDDGYIAENPYDTDGDSTDASTDDDDGPDF